MGQAREFPTDALGREVPFSAHMRERVACKLYCRAPELALDRDFLGTGVDVFALGVVLFTLLVGARPFDEAAWRQGSAYHGLVAQGGGDAEIVRLARKLCRNPLCSVCRDPAEDNCSCRMPASAANLIFHCIAPPPDRFTMQHVLDHAWLASPPA